jgi:hypothetical protein
VIKKAHVLPARIERTIVRLRGQSVMLDANLAALYEVETGALVRAVKRNRERFPGDFMFQLSKDEAERLRCQTGISNVRGGRRYLPYAFTEQGVAMLSSVLRSARAITVNVQIIRTFVKLRRMLGANLALSRKLDALEQNYDAKFRTVFQAIRELMASPPVVHRRIGFGTHERGVPPEEPRTGEAQRPHRSISAGPSRRESSARRRPARCVPAPRPGNGP